MSFAATINRQWADYADRHRNKTNLLIRILAVPAVWFASFQAVAGLFLMLIGVPGGFGMLFWALVLAGLALFAQVRGDAMEAVTPENISDPAERARRMAAENYVNFPRFVLLGRWLAAVRQA